MLAIGGLSSQFHATEIELSEDRIAEPAQDELNRQLLDLLAAGDADAIRAFLPDFSERARGDHHMKHLWWLLGATGGIEGATLHAYGPDYGSGMAVMEFAPVSAAAPVAVAAAPVGEAPRGVAGLAGRDAPGPPPRGLALVVAAVRRGVP